MKTPEDYAQELWNTWIAGTDLEENVPQYLVKDYLQVAIELFKECYREGQVVDK